MGDRFMKKLIGLVVIASSFCLFGVRAGIRRDLRLQLGESVHMTTNAIIETDQQKKEKLTAEAKLKLRDIYIKLTAYFRASDKNIIEFQQLYIGWQPDIQWRSEKRWKVDFFIDGFEKKYKDDLAKLKEEADETKLKIETILYLIVFEATMGEIGKKAKFKNFLSSFDKDSDLDKYKKDIKIFQEVLEKDFTSFEKTKIFGRKFPQTEGFKVVKNVGLQSAAVALIGFSLIKLYRQGRYKGLFGFSKTISGEELAKVVAELKELEGRDREEAIGHLSYRYSRKNIARIMRTLHAPETIHEEAVSLTTK